MCLYIHQASLVVQMVKNLPAMLHFMHISHLIFFANDVLLTVYFIFILDYRNVRQKAIQVIFLLFFSH